jgi:hypothetical protein
MKIDIARDAHVGESPFRRAQVSARRGVGGPLCNGRFCLDLSVFERQALSMKCRKC